MRFPNSGIIGPAMRNSVPHIEEQTRRNPVSLANNSHNPAHFTRSPKEQLDVSSRLRTQCQLAEKLVRTSNV
jgi:hypothetical protein